MNRVNEISKTYIIYTATLLVLIFGVFYQSKYPLWYLVFLALYVCVLIPYTTSVVAITYSKLIYVFTALVITVPFSIFISPMPMVSLSWGFVTLSGTLFLLTLSKNVAESILWALVAFLCVDIIVGFFDQIQLGTRRTYGLFADWNVRALYFIAISLFIFSKLFSENVQPKWAYWILIFALLVGFHSAQSRAMTYLVIIGVLVFFAFSLFSKKTPTNKVGWYIFVFVFSLVTYLAFEYLMFSQTGVNFGETRLIEVSSNFNGRIDIWRAAYVLILQEPLFGHGLGMFADLYRTMRVEYGSSGDFVHNDYLEYWVSSGVFGLFFMLIPTFFFAHGAFSNFRRKSFEGLVYSFVGLLILGCSFFNFIFWRIENIILLSCFWILVEQSNVERKSIVLSKYTKALIIAAVSVPMVVSVANARVDGLIQDNSIGASSDFEWTDMVLGSESKLYPVRAFKYLRDLEIQSLSEAEVIELNIIIGQLDKEIKRGSLSSAPYCARAEISGFLGQDLNLLESLVRRGLQLDPISAYCELVLVNSLLNDEREREALNSLVSFFQQPVDLRKSQSLMILSKKGQELANAIGFYGYESYFIEVESNLITGKKIRSFERF